MATNTVTSAVSPYMTGLAQFSQAYGATDADSYYNPSIFGYMDPSMAMMSMCNPMMMGLYNPAMMQQMFTPSAYDAMQRGISPMGSFYFNQPENFARYNHQNTNIQDGIRLLGEYAVSDNQDDFLATYQNLVASTKQRIKFMEPSISDADLETAARTQINTQFAQTCGASLSQVLKQHGDNPFWQGMKDVFSLGLFKDKQTVQENIAYVNGAYGTPQRKRDEALKWVGRGAAALCFITLATKKGSWKLLGKGLKMIFTNPFAKKVVGA